MSNAQDLIGKIERGEVAVVHGVSGAGEIVGFVLEMQLVGMCQETNERLRQAMDEFIKKMGLDVPCLILAGGLKLHEVRSKK